MTLTKELPWIKGWIGDFRFHERCILKVVERESVDQLKYNTAKLTQPRPKMAAPTHRHMARDKNVTTADESPSSCWSIWPPTQPPAPAFPLAVCVIRLIRQSRQKGCHFCLISRERNWPPITHGFRRSLDSGFCLDFFHPSLNRLRRKC